MKSGVCPICKLELEENGNIKFCLVCRREYYSIEPQKSYLDLQSDIEAVSDSESGEGPVLLCEDSNLTAFPFGKDHKKKDYLAEHFPNTTIETREYMST